MNRRNFLTSSTAALAAAGLAGCNPFQTVTPTSSTPNLQTAQVNFQQLAQIVTQQQCEEWCWAACMSMMFAFYGHPLSQEEIVVATYGNLVCLPAGTTTTIGRDLSRPYVDDNGVGFQSKILEAYDFFNNINTFNNQLIVDSLNANNPLLYCNFAHAMIVYSVSYIPTPQGPNIQAVQVVDPWPFNPRFHSLTPPEMVEANFGGQMIFLAQVKLI